MKKPVRTLVDSVVAAICACVLTASQVTAPDTVSSPRHPAVALTASATPLTVTVPELIDSVDTFAALVKPLDPDTGDPAVSVQAAAPGVAGAIAGPISYGFGHLATFVLRGAVGLLAPLLYDSVVGNFVGGLVLTTTFVGGAAILLVYSVIAGIERSVATAIRAIGSAFGGLLRLPAALLSGATAAAGSAEPSQRTAAAFTAGEHTEATADPEKTGQQSDAPTAVPSVDPQNAVDDEAPADVTAPGSAQRDIVDPVAADAPDARMASDEPEADAFVALDDTPSDETRLQPEPPSGSDEDAAGEDVDVKSVEEKDSGEKDAPVGKTSASSESPDASARSDTPASDET